MKEKIWYSPTGQVIKRVPMGAQVFQKMQYDGVGRVTKSFVCFDFNEADTNYDAAGSVATNINKGVGSEWRLDKA